MLKLRAKNAQALYTIVQSLFWLTHGLMFAFAAVYLQKRGFSSGGIPEEVLRRLNSHQAIPGGHLGLNNVDRIVRLSYGEQYGLTARVTEQGSLVCLRLPIQRGEEYAEGTDR